MPFHRRCRMTLTSMATTDIKVHYLINYTLTEVPENCAYFHAQYWYLALPTASFPQLPGVDELEII